MPKLIIIHGPTGAGKTTICNLLHEKLRPKFVLIDRGYIKDTILKDVKQQDPEFVKKLTKKIVFDIVRPLMEKGWSIILPEFVVTSIHKHLGEHVEQYNYEVLSFYLSCPRDVSAERVAQRKGDPKITPEWHGVVYDKAPGEQEKDIVIETNKYSKEEVVEMIISQIHN